MRLIEFKPYSLSVYSQKERRIHTLSDEHKRYGFWKIYRVIRKKGYEWNHKRVYRLYFDLKLNLRKRLKKRLPSREKVKLIQPVQRNDTWSLDFMSDAISSGRKFRTVNILDDCNRDVIGILASFSLPAIRVTEFLDDICGTHGYPLSFG